MTDRPPDHGWRLERNYGNYGAYGWGLGVWYSRPIPPWGEASVSLQFGPWKMELSKRKKVFPHANP